MGWILGGEKAVGGGLIVVRTGGQELLLGEGRVKLEERGAGHGIVHYVLVPQKRCVKTPLCRGLRLRHHCGG